MADTPGPRKGAPHIRVSSRSSARSDAGTGAGTGPSGLPAAGLRFLAQRPRVLAALAGWSLLEAAQTFLLGYGIAQALDQGFLAGDPRAGLLWLAVSAAGVLAGAVGTGRVYRAVAALAEPLRDLLVQRVVHNGLHEAVHRARAGDTAVVSRLTHQVELARDSFAGLVMVARSFLFTSAGALTGLLWLAPPLLLVVLPPLLAGLAVFGWSLRPLARRQRAFLVADEAIAEDFGATAEGLRDVVAAGAEDEVAADGRQLIAAEFRAARALARWSVTRAVALGIGGRLPIVLLLVMAPWLLAHGVSAGALVGALTYLTQALLPALQNLVHGLGGAGARLAVVIGRLRGKAQAPDPEPDPEPSPGPGLPPDPEGKRPATARQAKAPREPGARRGAVPEDRPPSPPVEASPGASPTSAPLPPSAAPRAHAGSDSSSHRAERGPDRAFGARPGHQKPPAVELRGVTFGYGRHAEPVVHGLDLAVPAGGRLAVVGPSGTGKSTLAGLVAGLLVPQEGEVRVCGEPVAEAGTARLARLRALIPQEAYVFTGTLRENVRYLCPCPDPAVRETAEGDREAAAAAAALGADGLVDRLGGWDAAVDPAVLSAGERQLIALVRAYLSPAPVVVLDEATGRLDPAAEARAERAFAARPGGTLLIVAHRISSAARADRALVLDGPRVACGTHRELLECSALYRALWGTWSASGTVQTQPAL